jgi:capsid portal protein
MNKSALRKAVRVGVGDVPAGVTAQPEDPADRWTPDHAIQPPEDLDRLASLTQLTRWRRPVIEAVVVNTVGQGFEIVPREGREDEAKEGEARELAEHLNALSRRDLKQKRPSFKQHLKMAKWDEEEVGSGYIEVSRNRITGEIDGLFHAPGKLVRRRRDRKGWVVGPKNGSGHDLMEFYDFGDKVKYDAEGRPEGTLNGTGKRWDRNELIVFQLYTSQSRDYGLPRDTHLALDYLGDRSAAQANVSYFGGSGVPPTLIFLKAPKSDDPNAEEIEIEVPPDLEKKIAAAVRSGGEARHRVGVFTLPEGVEPQSIDLATLSERDLNFIEFRKDNRRATLGAWRLAPVFVADIEDTNYSTAATERELTKEQVFDSEQDRWEDILSESIIRELAPHMRLKLAEIDVTDDKAQRESADSLAERKAITYREFREAHGLEPLPEADESAETVEPGQVEYGWNGRLIEVAVGDDDGSIKRGAEAAARLLAEGNPGGIPTGVE